MLYGRVGDTYLCIHPATAPSNAEWDDWLLDIEREAPTLKGLLVYSEGGAPNASQRKKTADMWERQGNMPPIAVLTGSSIVRTVLTALNFFLSRPIRGFAPSEVEDALARHIGLDPLECAAVRKVLGPSLERLHQPQTVSP